jgi:hypothetical protein
MLVGNKVETFDLTQLVVLVGFWGVLRPSGTSKRR